ncbi:hypothetical protein [Streptomyces capoamus]|uniref:hypothetical protein n=1 Tax=Streptomyces capoamus TaxID=68183 RepID=UPI003390AB68
MSALMEQVAALVARQTAQRLAELEKTRQRLDELEETRQRLPLLDPDRHDIDPVDIACRRLAPTSEGGTA